MGRFTIAIAGQKGGVAKTTTAMNLAGAFAEQGKRVLAIDLDPQGNLTVGLGFHPKEINQSATEVLLKGVPLEKALYHTKIEEIDLLPSTPTLRFAEQILPRRPNYRAVLRQALENAVDNGYKVVIIDSPPSLGALTANALTAANLALLPTQAEYFAAYALKATLQMVQTIRQSSNPNLAYRILITMFRRRNRALALIRARLEATFGNGLCKTVIETDTKIRESAIAGLPVTHFSPKTRSAMQYRALAQELALYAQKEELRETY